MHICFLSQEFPRKGAIYGGIGTFLSTFTSQLIGGGHQVTVISITYKGEFSIENLNGVTLYSVPRSNLKFFNWWRNFKEIEKIIHGVHQKTPIDIVEGSELNFAFLKKDPTIKYIIRLHGGHHFFAEGENRKIDSWKGFQEKRSFAKADGFIAVSDYVRNHTEKLLSYNGKPVEKINYPIPLDKFYMADSYKTIKGRLVFAGTTCEKKGIRQLIAALPIASKKYPELHLEVYGRDWLFQDGKSFVNYLKEIFSSEIMKKVTFHGPVSHDDLPGFYEQAEICVFPSHMETQGLVAPEAMAMGKPVIFSKTGPGPETIDHGINGWLCDPHDPQDIARLIEEALDRRAELQTIGEAAKAKVYSKFEPELITKRNLKFFQKILNS
jgi:glycosyltransferase involved in cell wall biosynthesis